MDELLETAKKYLHSGKPDVALSVLRQSGNEKPEYIQLMTICRNMLSEQYVYVIKENLNKNQLSEAQKVILQYQENLGSSAAIQNFRTEIEKKESVDGGLLYRLSKVPLKKITKVVTILFTVMTVLFIIWEYVLGWVEVGIHNFIFCGLVTGLFFPYSDGWSVVFTIVMFVAFILWCRFFVVLHKVVY